MPCTGSSKINLCKKKSLQTFSFYSCPFLIKVSLTLLIEPNQTELNRDWVRLSLIIEHNPTLTKNLSNRAQSNVRVNSIGLDQVRLVRLGSIRFNLRMDVDFKTMVVKFTEYYFRLQMGVCCEFDWVRFSSEIERNRTLSHKFLDSILFYRTQSFG